MDPTEALINLRREIARALRQQRADTDEPRFCVVDNATVTAIAEGFDALDTWLARGGFLPTDWHTGNGGHA